MHNHFRVGMRIKLMPAAFQIFPQLRKVENFTVEDYPYSFVLVVNRLMAPLQVNNAQPAHSESDVSLGVDSLVVRTSMNNCVAHGVDLNISHHRIRFGSNYPRDTAHCC